MRNLDIVAILMTILLIPGMFGNTQLIYATFKFKQLQHRNGLLVGIIAGLNFVNQLFETVNAIEIFIGKSLMERRTCNLTIFVYGFSFNMANIVILFLAFDRILAVSSPTKYRTIRSSRFIVITFVVGFIYATPFLILGFIVADNTLVEPCNPPSALAPPLVAVWTYAYSTIAVIVILLNIANYFIMRSSQKQLVQRDAANYQRQMRVTKSLRVMMIVYALTTVLASLVLFVIELLTISEELIAEITSYVCIPVLISYSSHYYVLFWRSENYRKIFLKLLGFGRINPITSTGTIMVQEMLTRDLKQQQNNPRSIHV